MKINKLNKISKLKKSIVLVATLVVIVGIASICVTFAKYRYTSSVQIASGTIHWTQSDLQIVAVKLENDGGDYDSSDTVPTSGYTLNTELSVCKVNGTVDSSIVIEYNEGKVNILNLTQKGTKCDLYFDIQNSALDLILANNTLDSTRKTGTLTAAFTEDTAGRIFEGPADDYGDTTYFFAGANPNNWVKFAGFYWRIIRVNGNGSLRLIYNGTDTTTTGTTTQLSSTSAFNSSYDDNAYVGYMYGTTGSSTYAATHANTNNSTIKGVLDTWYTNNLASYSDKIDTDVGFCGDRTVATSDQTWWTSDTRLGYGKNATAYIGFSRRITTSNSWASTQTAVYTCNQTNDLYTVSSSSYGNKALTYPIGLITVDEVQFAGGFGGSSNSSYWLYTGQNYWTMSPSYFSGSYAYAFYVYSAGNLSGSIVGVSRGVRPVLSIASDSLTSGTGTVDDPFVV